MLEKVEAILAKVVHPALEKDIVTLGLVDNIKVEDSKIRFQLVFPSPDPLSGSIKKSCEQALLEVFPEMKISIIELVKERKIKKAVSQLGQEQLGTVNKIIAIASGKGGVGKSTVTVNLAVALARMGYKVGVADADVYGPSMPKMTGTEGQVPQVEDINEQGEPSDLIIPIEKFGVKWMSIGYFASPEQALIWRGPMACNALKQMILQVRWGELDFLLIDLPPGTGDIHISIANDIPLSGAIIVTTPQAVALADVLKGINLFRNEKVNIPILGLVENMAWFTPAELPENKYYIFGRDGGVKMAEKLNIPLLAQVPIIQSIRESGDEGIPSAFLDGIEAEAFATLAKLVSEKA